MDSRQRILQRGWSEWSFKHYLTKKQITEVLKLAELRQEANPKLRYGQAFFNALYVLYPHTAQEIRATDKDPFYHDSKVIECMLFIKTPYEISTI